MLCVGVSLMEKDSLENRDIIGLLEQTVTYCLDKGYTVIIEGIFSKQKHRDVLIELLESVACKTYVFYLEVSLEETLWRHQTKSFACELGEKEIRSWYLPKNYLDVPNEIIIPEVSTLEETVTLISESV